MLSYLPMEQRQKEIYILFRFLKRLATFSLCQEGNLITTIEWHIRLVGVTHDNFLALLICQINYKNFMPKHAYNL